MVRNPRVRRWSHLLAMAIIFLVGLLLYAHFTWRTLPAFGDPADSVALMEQIIAAAPRTLVLAAHPDDVEWYLGGTVARLTAAGAEVTIVMATNGERGRGPQPGLGDLRRAEQEEAAKRLGVHEVVFLGLPDGGLHQSTEPLVELIASIWRQLEPALVFAFDAALPRPPYIHPDHQAIGRAVAGLHAGGLGKEAVVLLYHSRRPDTLIDISPVMDKKLHALAAHLSQGMGSRMGAAHRGSAEQLGQLAGVSYAEAFRLKPTPTPDD